MKLESFYLSYLTHNELHRLGHEVVSVIDEFFSRHAWLAEVGRHTEALLGDLRRVLDRGQGKELTQAIRAADEARDDAFRALRAGVEFAQLHLEEKTRQAGNRLQGLLETHARGVLEAGYGEQTTMVDALLDALAQPENTATVRDANLEPFVLQLQQTEDEFKALIRRRQDTDAVESLPLLNEARAALHENLTLIHASLRYLATTEPEAAAAAIGTLNERAQTIITPAKSRRTRTTNDAAINTTLPTEPEPVVLA